MTVQRLFYRVLRSGLKIGQVYNVGDVIALTAEQAKFHLPPYRTQLELIETAASVDLASALALHRTQWIGALAADPTLDADGHAVTPGARYYNTQTARIRILKPDGWHDEEESEIASAAAAAAASSADLSGRRAQQALDAVAAVNEQAAAAAAAATDAAAARDVVLAYVDGGVIKANLAATRAPAKTDDATQGYAQGSPWHDGTTGVMWRCVDPAAGAARWAQSEAHPGLVSGRLYPIYDGVTGTTVALPAASTLYVVPFKVPALMPVSALRFRVVTGAAGSNIKAGLYANNYVAGSGFARPIGAPIAVCNAATPTATSNADVSCPVTTLMLTPDLIYWAAVKSDGTPTFHAMASTDLTIERLIGRASANGNTCLTGLSIASTFASDLPTLTGAESWTEVLGGALPVVRIA